MKCTKCGKEIEDGMRFCNYCGERMVKESRRSGFELNETREEREQRLLQLLKVKFGAPITL